MKRILLIRTDKIGDVLLSTPAIEFTRQLNPDAYIAVMVAPAAEQIVKDNPYINEVVVFDKKEKDRGIFATLKFIDRMKKKNFDIAVILHSTTRVNIICYLAGIKKRVGYGRKMAKLLSQAIEYEKHLGQKHEIDYTIDVVRHAFSEFNQPAPEELFMPVNKQDRERTDSLLSEYGIIPKDKIIVINPTASCPSKMWIPERFAKISEVLSNKYNCKIVFISSAADKHIVDKVISLAKGEYVSLAGETDMRQLAVILNRALLLVSNDSGPVHIASAMKTPTVVIFGRKQEGLGPKRWAPTGKDNVVLKKDVGCKQCLAHNCKIGFKCLEAITIDEVIRAVEQLLPLT